MTPLPPANGTPPPRTLRRATDERFLFGVCAGLARYLDVDPTVVRVAFVVAGLFPPIGGALVLAYILMAFIIPAEDAADASGRQQARDNFSSLRSELSGLTGSILDRITGEPRQQAPSAPTPVGDEPAERKAA